MAGSASGSPVGEPPEHCRWRRVWDSDRGGNSGGGGGAARGAGSEPDGVTPPRLLLVAVGSAVVDVASGSLVPRSRALSAGVAQ
jgi:hypothetical protein